MLRLWLWLLALADGDIFFYIGRDGDERGGQQRDSCEGGILLSALYVSYNMYLVRIGDVILLSCSDIPLSVLCTLAIYAVSIYKP